MWVLVQISATSFDQIPAHVARKAEDSSYVKDSDETPGFWLYSDPTPTTVTIWGVNRQKEDLVSVSLSLLSLPLSIYILLVILPLK